MDKKDYKDPFTINLPTLDLPAKAISGIRFLGKSLGEAAEIKNSTLLKFM